VGVSVVIVPRVILLLYAHHKSNRLPGRLLFDIGVACAQLLKLMLQISRGQIR